MTQPHIPAIWAQRIPIGGITILISTDPQLLDIDYLHGALAGQYWCRGIPRPVVERSLANSLCFGLYNIVDPVLPGRIEQIGLARVITDFATFAYLCDVFVDEQFRGRGLGKRLMNAVMQHPDLQQLRRFMLMTKDAHALYSQFGFAPLAAPDRAMERCDPDIYSQSGSSGG